MTANSKSVELALRLWRQVYQTYTLLKTCEDQIFEEYGLTTEQYGVLVAMGYLDSPIRITDIARWLERSTNSISMIVDRMVKAGLVTRKRDRSDRRVVYVSSTSKAENALRPATLASFEVVSKILSPLSYEDRSTLLSLLGTVKYEIMRYLNPGVNIKEVKGKELEQAANVKQWLNEYGLPSTLRAKRQGGEKRKTKKKTE
jgi:DNA-binding MarR family transcriptional regulator